MSRAASTLLRNPKDLFRNPSEHIALLDAFAASSSWKRVPLFSVMFVLSRWSRTQGQLGTHPHRSFQHSMLNTHFNLLKTVILLLRRPCPWVSAPLSTPHRTSPATFLIVREVQAQRTRSSRAQAKPSAPPRPQASSQPLESTSALSFVYFSAQKWLLTAWKVCLHWR